MATNLSLHQLKFLNNHRSLEYITLSITETKTFIRLKL